MPDIIWVLWIWFIPFGATMDSRVITVPISHDPPFLSRESCELDKAELVPKLADMWPDPKANVERIEVYCVPQHRPHA
jgi:hypothetical protein